MISCPLITFLLVIVTLFPPVLTLKGPSEDNEHSPSGTDFWGSEIKRKPPSSNGASHTSGGGTEGTDDSHGTNDQEDGDISLSISNKTESTKGNKKKPPKKNSLSVSIGGAQIELDLPVVHDSNDTSTTMKPLNGEEVSAGNSHLPEFVFLADDSGRKSLMELQQNTNIPKGSYQLALSSWASKQGEPVNTSFHRYLAEQEDVGRRNREDVLRKLANLSQAARDADAQMQENVHDPSITKKSEEAQIQKYFNSLPKRVREELNTLNVDGIQTSKSSK